MQSICRIWNRFHETSETFSGDGFVRKTITWLCCYCVLFAVDANFCSLFTVNMRVCCCDKENILAKLYIKLCRNLLYRNTLSQWPWRPVLHSEPNVIDLSAESETGFRKESVTSFANRLRPKLDTGTILLNNSKCIQDLLLLRLTSKLPNGELKVGFDARPSFKARMRIQVQTQLILGISSRWLPLLQKEGMTTFHHFIYWMIILLLWFKTLMTIHMLSHQVVTGCMVFTRVRPMYTSDIENRRHRSLLEHRRIGVDKSPMSML